MFSLRTCGQRFGRVYWHLVPVGGTDCQRFLKEYTMRLSALGLLAGALLWVSSTSCWSSFPTDAACPMLRRE